MGGLATTADELLALVRGELSDPIEPGLWKDSELYSYMTEACDALARDTLFLIKIYTLSYTATVPTVALTDDILHIREARDVASNRRLRPANANSQGFETQDDYGLQLTNSSSLFAGSGPVSCYVRDYEVDALRLVPIPEISGTIELECSVVPNLTMDDGVILPFKQAPDHRLLLEYMKMRAYMKHDADSEDLVRAEKHRAIYEEGAQKRKDAVRNYRRTPGVVRMEGW